MCNVCEMYVYVCYMFDIPINHVLAVHKKKLSVQYRQNETSYMITIQKTQSYTCICSVKT